MFGVRDLLMVEKVLLRMNDLAAVPASSVASGIQKVVDRWDKCIN